MVNKKILDSIILYKNEGGVVAPSGFIANGISCGIKQSGKKDLCIIYSKDKCNATAVFTTNKIKAAPLRVSKSNINNKIHTIICNSGNANACTGKQGMKDARAMVKKTCEIFETPPGSTLVASTGVIGVNLPMQSVDYGITKIKRKIMIENNVRNATDAIMTTDTRRKIAKVVCKIGGKTITIGGIAKGSGMINPNMATMLAFLTTDANISSGMMHKALRYSVKHSFNKITVDGQMSTNDSVFLIANGVQNNVLINRDGSNYSIFENALLQICEALAHDIVNDGEGVSKVIKIRVKGASKKTDAEKIAREIANSPLVKTAFYGQSSNWGRIMQAIGASGVSIKPDKIDIFINNTAICLGGAGCGLSRVEGRQLLNKRSIDLLVNLGIGHASDYVYTTDLTYDYVKINSHYS